MATFIDLAVNMSVEIELRPLEESEIDLIWSEINRRELITQMYWQNHDELEAYDCHHEVESWDRQMLAKDPIAIKKAYAKGAACIGAWHAQRLVGVAVVNRGAIESFVGARLLQYFYVDADYRGQGIGAQLMQAAKNSLAQLKGNALYISSIPTCNTVDFYISQGAEVLPDPDPRLLELEPEDIHLICPL